MVDFKEGVKWYINNQDAILGSRIGSQYIDDVNSAINELTNNINKLSEKNTPIEQLKGNAAEFWHAGTFNINAAVNGNNYRAVVPESNAFASPDIKVGKENYGLKYYSTAEQTVKAQSISYFEKYNKTYPNNERSFDEFLKERGISESDVMHDPIYKGQIRIVPSDQLEQAREYLEKQISKEANKRPELVDKYQETYEKLDSIIKDNKGNKSIELSKKDAEELARLGKEEKFDARDFGLTTEELISFSHIFNQAFKAGVTAMTLSITVKMAPEVYNAIKYLIANGELDKNQIKEMGYKALSSGGEGFVRGFVSASVIAYFKSGLFGASIKNIDPSVVGVITVLTINTMKYAMETAKGTMTRGEFANELIKDLFVTTGAMSVGTLTQELIPIPILGFMVGSMVGSMVGTFIYDKGYSVAMSFFVESGFTLFGLVEQNYELPESILDDIGMDIIKLNKLEISSQNNYGQFKADKFAFDRFEPENFDIKVLRRGVIGISIVGYAV